jgi:hypothetical protein
MKHTSRIKWLAVVGASVFILNGCMCTKRCCDSEPKAKADQPAPTAPAQPEKVKETAAR